MQIGIMPNLQKPRAIKLTREVIEILDRHGISPWIDTATAQAVDRQDLVNHDEVLDKLDVVLVLGGDGTLLHAARKVAEYEIPILGINVGHLGFLTELEADQIEKALTMLINKDYSLEERMLIEGTVTRNEQKIATFLAVNDLVITRGTFARIIQLSAYVDQQHVGDYLADGIIVATPTGSTAYSLSAGGPIIEPVLDCLIITPICPHTLSARSVIVRPDSMVRVSVQASHEDVMLTIDGQIGFPLQSLDAVDIGQSPLKARFIKFEGRNFFSVLNTRMQTIHSRKDYGSES